MTAATEKILTGAELRSLSVRSDARGTARLAVHLLLLGAGGWLVARSGPWTVVPAMLLLGVAQAALFAPIHETMHMTAFRSRRANTIVGWLVAIRPSTSPTTGTRRIPSATRSSRSCRPRRSTPMSGASWRCRTGARALRCSGTGVGATCRPIPTSCRGPRPGSSGRCGSWRRPSPPVRRSRWCSSAGGRRSSSGSVRRCSASPSCASTF